MTRLVLPLLLALSLAACAPDRDEQTEATERSQAAANAAAQPVADAATAPPPVSEGGCDDVQAQWLVGKPATDADVEQARKDAKATLVRQLKPGQAVTLEFNESRLNVELDAKGVVTAVRCG
ncbi:MULTISPECIES: I78 family peptidase inhibitor [unclassified Pseudoxanthomonas]|uniref:I78 family peptidase inhibitor n=1 Tax=unclassified Pseudoxanthomonas TaxID=2645906 RepID=UPI0030777C2B